VNIYINYLKINTIMLNNMFIKCYEILINHIAYKIEEKELTLQTV
jgi:hypothetical protein